MSTYQQLVVDLSAMAQHGSTEAEFRRVLLRVKNLCNTSLKQTADMVGVPTGTIDHWLRGFCSCTSSNRMKHCAKLLKNLSEHQKTHWA